MGLQFHSLVLISWVLMTLCLIQGKPNDCKDNLKTCGIYAGGDCDGKYRAWAMKHCRKTCNLCDEDASKDQTKCKDYYTECARNGKKYPHQCDPEYNKFNGNKHAETDCRKYCGLCDPSKKYTGPTLNKKSCESKWTEDGNEYEHQMKWQANCMTCTCDDGGVACVNIVCRGPDPNKHNCRPLPPAPKDCCFRYICDEDRA